MVPVIAANGASFRGAFQYYCHDKQGRTTDRVDWAQTINMLTDCVGKAWKVMAYTAKHQERLKDVSGQKATGAKIKKPVFAFSLSWAPEQQPDKMTMLDAARQSLAALGLSDHQAIIVAHNDRPHRHVHIVANTVHPLTGLVAPLKYTKRKLSDFALGYEREHGKIYCKQREENQLQREEGKPTRYRDPHIIEAWRTTTTGPAFVAALAAKGYRLEEGRNRLIVIDPHGKALNPTRHLQGVKAADIRARLETPEPVQQPEPEDPALDERTTAEPEARPDTPSWNELAQQQRESLYEKQRHQRKQIHRQHELRLADAKKHLAGYFRLPEQRQSLRSLRDQLRLAPWWKRVLGMTRKERQRFETGARFYQQSLKQYRAKMADIVQQDQKIYKAVLASHERERTAFESALEQRRTRSQGNESSGRTPSRSLTKVFSARSMPVMLENTDGGPQVRTGSPPPAYDPPDQHGQVRDNIQRHRDGRSLV